MPPTSPVRDKNVESKQRKTYANRGENHTEKMMKVLSAKQVLLLPGKLIKHNCSSNNLKQGKILKHDKRVIGQMQFAHKFLSGEFPVLK